jgi:phi LC3 family holin
MKINFTVRFKNPQFWINLAVSVFGIILAYFGLNFSELTTWSSIGHILIESVKNPVVVFAILACIWNALNDPTTKGLSDSKQALTYSEPK